MIAKFFFTSVKNTWSCTYGCSFTYTANRKLELAKAKLMRFKLHFRTFCHRPFTTHHHWEILILYQRTTALEQSN